MLIERLMAVIENASERAPVATLVVMIVCGVLGAFCAGWTIGTIMVWAAGYQ